METLGTDFNNTGSVMSRSQLEEVRQKRGECLTCGQKCFRKKLFKLIPITEEGKVLEGRCLNCRPLNGLDGSSASVASVPRKATPQDLERFTKSQLNLSSRTLLHSTSTPMSSPLPHRAMARTLSTLPPTTPMRSDNHSVGSSSTISSRPPSQNLTRALSHSVVPSGHSSIRSRESSLSPPPTSRTIAKLNATATGSIGEMSSLQSGRSGANNSHDNFMASESQLSYDGFGSISELPAIARTPSRGEYNPLRRRSSHSDAMSSSTASSSMAVRISVSKSNSGDFPSREELEQAQRTILAAQQHGIYINNIDSHDQQQQYQNGGLKDRETQDYHNHLPSASASFRSGGGSISEGHDVIDGAYGGHQHGLSESFVFSPSQNGRAHFTGSVGSLGSISPHGSTRSPARSPTRSPARSPNNSRRVIPNGGIMLEGLYLGDSATGGVSGKSEQHDNGPTEKDYLNTLRQVGQNVGEILLIVREAVDFPQVVSTGLDQLAKVKLTPDDQDMLGDMGAPLVIANVMNSHSSNLAIQLAACGAIWNMSGTKQNQIAFVNAGALDMILTAMDRFIDKWELQEKAIATLSNLGAVGQNLPVLDDKGAITRIVEAMNKHAEISSLQVKGCGAVTNLASHDNVPMKQRIVECGGGGAVVVAMVMHPNDPYLQEKALRAIRNLCANCDANKAEIGNIGGIDSVISAMQVHRDEAAVQQEGAWTLSNLAGNELNKSIIGDCGGIDVVIRAMWVHSDKVGVQEWCCRALFTLTLDPQNSNVVLEVGGISAIVSAMQGHVDSSTVQEMGCAVLGNLAETDQARLRIVDEEALDAIVLAMVLHTDNIQVQERACMVLMHLAIDANINSMKAANIPELVRTAAHQFPDRCDEPASQILRAFGGAY